MARAVRGDGRRVGSPRACSTRRKQRRRGGRAARVRMRPRTLDEVIGQDTDQRRTPFRKLVDNDAPMSLLLWGPPGHRCKGAVHDQGESGQRPVYRAQQVRDVGGEGDDQRLLFLRCRRYYRRLGWARTTACGRIVRGGLVHARGRGRAGCPRLTAFGAGPWWAAAPNAVAPGPARPRPRA